MTIDSITKSIDVADKNISSSNGISMNLLTTQNSKNTEISVESADDNNQEAIDSNITSNEDHKQNNNTSEVSQETDNQLLKKSTPPANRPFRSHIQCYECRQYGHKSSECRSRNSNNYGAKDRAYSNNNESSLRRSDNITCHKCGEPGHIAPDCRFKFYPKKNGINRGLAPCRFWMNGHCRLGDDCKYFHGVIPDYGLNIPNYQLPPNVHGHPGDGCLNPNFDFPGMYPHTYDPYNNPAFLGHQGYVDMMNPFMNQYHSMHHSIQPHPMFPMPLTPFDPYHHGNFGVPNMKMNNNIRGGVNNNFVSSPQKTLTDSHIKSNNEPNEQDIMSNDNSENEDPSVQDPDQVQNSPSDNQVTEYSFEENNQNIQEEEVTLEINHDKNIDIESIEEIRFGDHVEAEVEKDTDSNTDSVNSSEANDLLKEELNQSKDKPEDLNSYVGKMHLTPKHGLVNATGQNNCFLNVVIQALFHIDVFQRLFHEAQAHDCKGIDQCLYCSLKQIFEELGQDSDSLVSSKAIRNALSYSTQSRFELGEMDDAVEAHDTILECLHNLFTKKQDRYCKGSSDPVLACPVHQAFGMCVSQQAKCNRCDHQANVSTYDTFVVYALTNKLHQAQLEYPGKTFGSILEHAMLTDSKPCPQPRCRKDKFMSTKIQLEKTPTIFTLGLTWPTAQPNKDFLRSILGCIDHKIDLNNMVNTSDPKENVEISGQLLGMFCYFGRHYIAFFYHAKTQQWMFFDDEVVYPIGSNWNYVIEHCLKGMFQPLVLFYEVNENPKEENKSLALPLSLPENNLMEDVFEFTIGDIVVPVIEEKQETIIKKEKVMENIKNNNNLSTSSSLSKSNRSRKKKIIKNYHPNKIFLN